MINQSQSLTNGFGPYVKLYIGAVLRQSDVIALCFISLCRQNYNSICPINSESAHIVIMIYKELLSVLAIALTFIAFFPYICSILKGKTKPHAFSWVIWSCCTFIVFLAQLADKGGVGAWPIGFSGIITIYVAILAYRACA